MCHWLKSTRNCAMYIMHNIEMRYWHHMLMIEDADIFIYQCHRSIIENNVSLALSGNSNTIDQQLSDATYVALEPKKQLKIVTLHRLKAFRFLRLIILI